MLDIRKAAGEVTAGVSYLATARGVFKGLHEGGDSVCTLKINVELLWDEGTADPV